MKYPIGIQDFKSIREDGFVYVDKTEQVYNMTHESKVYFLGRPRRFGKSLLMSTLKYYFLGEKKLFKGLAIDNLEKEWKNYPVFCIDFGLGRFIKSDSLDNVIKAYLSDWEKMYDVERTVPEDEYSLRMDRILKEAHLKTGLRAVVLIDEYDKPLLDVMDMGFSVEYQGRQVSLEEYNKEVLRAFYATFKAADEHLRFVMLTGVTKFSQVSMFSGFNQPTDISMSGRYDTVCGITGEEMLAHFSEPIKKMSEFYRCSFDEMVEKLQKQYDGYHFSDRLHGVYNPFSLLNAFFNLRIQDYWFRTGTPTYLIRLLSHFDENINELTNRYYTPDQFIDYRADVERPLPMIFQGGYLTIKDFKMRNNTFLLDFPNDEVKRGFVTLIANNYLKPKEEVSCWLMDAIDALDDGKLEQFHTQLAAFLASIPYTMRRKEDERERERYFHYTFYLLLRLLSTYVVYTEKVQSQGRVDCIVETMQYVYIFEFKLDGTASEALQQIVDKGYAREYESNPRKIYQIGCSFSSETGTIDGWEVQ